MFKKDTGIEMVERIIELDGKYQEKLIDRIRELMLIINKMQEHLEENCERWKKYARTNEKEAWRLLVCKENLNYLEVLRDMYEAR